MIVSGIARAWPGYGWIGLGLFGAACIVAIAQGHHRSAARLAATVAIAFLGLGIIYTISTLALPGLLGASAARVELFPAICVALGIPLLALAHPKSTAADG